MSERNDLLGALLPVAEALDRLGVGWYVGGSVASGAFGEFRATNDVDVVADLHVPDAEPLVAALGEDYYADLDAIRSAILRRASFSAVHYGTMLKIDVFVMRARAYDRQALGRRVMRRVGPADAASIPLASPEDVILAKLEWFRAGGGISERQWRDVQGVLRVQSTGIDVTYLRSWAAELGVQDLLERALAEAGG